jgi:hypothetical protein
MASKATTVEQYLEELPDDRRPIMTQLHNTIMKNLPKGFEAVMNYGMIGYVVPHSLYPNGYHCDTKLPLPFMGLASQKNNLSLYHMGMYADNDLTKWFADAYQSLNIGKLDMGKSCIRLKKLDQIPIDLIAELCKKMSPAAWIKMYESELKN